MSLVLILKEGLGQKADKAIQKILTSASFFQSHYLILFRSMEHQCEDFLESLQIHCPVCNTLSKLHHSCLDTTRLYFSKTASCPAAQCHNLSVYFKAYLLGAREILFQRNPSLCLTLLTERRKLGNHSVFACILLRFPANFHTQTVTFFSSAIKYSRSRSSQEGTIFPAQVNFTWHFLSLLLSVPMQPIPLQGSA